MVELRGFEPLSKIANHLNFYMLSQLNVFDIRLSVNKRPYIYPY